MTQLIKSDVLCVCTPMSAYLSPCFAFGDAVRYGTVHACVCVLVSCACQKSPALGTEGSHVQTLFIYFVRFDFHIEWQRQNRSLCVCSAWRRNVTIFAPNYDWFKHTTSRIRGILDFSSNVLRTSSLNGILSHFIRCDRFLLSVSTHQFVSDEVAPQPQQPRHFVWSSKAHIQSMVH